MVPVNFFLVRESLSQPMIVVPSGNAPTRVSPSLILSPKKKFTGWFNLKGLKSMKSIKFMDNAAFAKWPPSQAHQKPTYVRTLALPSLRVLFMLTFMSHHHSSSPSPCTSQSTSLENLVPTRCLSRRCMTCNAVELVGCSANLLLRRVEPIQCLGACGTQDSVLELTLIS
jgi:hypothetical protein